MALCVFEVHGKVGIKVDQRGTRGLVAEGSLTVHQLSCVTAGCGRFWRLPTCELGCLRGMGTVPHTRTAAMTTTTTTTTRLKHAAIHLADS